MSTSSQEKTKRIKILPAEYASFRSDIISFFIKNILQSGHSVLDPMCGSAPLIPFAEKMELTLYLNDILPIHYFINQAKTYKVFRALKQKNINDSSFLLKKTLDCLKMFKSKKLYVSEKWLHDDVLEGLTSAWNKSQQYEEPLSIFLKAIIILCIRPLSSITRSEKNVTWFKAGGVSSCNDINLILKEKVDLFFKYYATNYNNDNDNDNDKYNGEFYFSTFDAKYISLPNKVDFVITSPPYCNRLDYERLYAPELYFLKSIGFITTSSEILATNMVQDYNSIIEDVDYISKVSPKTYDFLNTVNEKRKDDVQYYTKYFTRYFVNLFKIMANSLSLIKENGALYVIVQNNIHRGEMVLINDFLADFFKHLDYKVEFVFKELRMHQGRRNISEEYPLVIKKQNETILKVEK